MSKFSFKIAFSIIAAGLFIVVSFAALYYENLNSYFYMVALPVIVFIFLFGLAMGKTYAIPLGELLKQVSNVNKGNLKSKSELKTKDEVEELSKNLNKITEGLEKSVEEIETVKKASDIKFKTKDIVSEKVIDALEEKVKNRTSELERVSAERDKLVKELEKKK